MKIGEKCCVIGTLFKKMELKPVILKELSVEVRSVGNSQLFFHFWFYRL
jgi:hypothetical protein